MGLFQYEVDCSALEESERSDLLGRIQDLSFDGGRMTDRRFVYTFTLEAAEDLPILKIPDQCPLRRIL